MNCCAHRSRRAANGPTQLLGNLVRVAPQTQFAVVTHYNIRPVIDLYVSVEKRDLGSVATQVDKLVDNVRGDAAARQPDHGARPGADHAHVRSSVWAWAWRWRSCWCIC